MVGRGEGGGGEEEERPYVWFCGFVTLQTDVYIQPKRWRVVAAILKWLKEKLLLVYCHSLSPLST